MKTKHTFILQKESYCCEHEKPHKLAYTKKVFYWEIRTCTIKEFDKRFGEREGTWLSKGKKHCEIPAQGNYSDSAIWCKRRKGLKEVWAIDLDLKGIVKLAKTHFIKIYEDTEFDTGTIVIKLP